MRSRKLSGVKDRYDGFDEVRMNLGRVSGAGLSVRDVSRSRLSLVFRSLSIIIILVMIIS